MDFEKIKNLSAELQELRVLTRNTSEQLAREILKSEDITKGLSSGALKLNFPAPTGFYRHIRRITK